MWATALARCAAGRPAAARTGPRLLPLAAPVAAHRALPPPALSRAPAPAPLWASTAAVLPTSQSRHPLASLRRTQPAGVGGALLVTTRGFYFPRSRWFPWRARLAQRRQAALRKKRHIWPRGPSDAEEAPIFRGKDEGVIQFREKQIVLGLKRLTTFAKLIRGRHLQDAIDWIESLARMQTKPILKLLRHALKECSERHGKDPARLYVYNAHPLMGTYVKSIKRHIQGRYGVVKSPRHSFEVQVREMPLEEFFHRLYIRGKVPRSLAADMRLALHERRVSGQMVKEWSPYLCANSRFFHRKELKWLDSTRQFHYYEARREWIDRYRAQLLRSSTEAREARGLPALPPSV
eukprot:TRINITY_DN37408_c0_g1_i1.p1 TRINITY_DN37408_c0_g1~~TRINITY_DN37408_c0_g1_i1.p1  ORF type:complete len:370 (-),score=46.60 TRINITY_DN37408_c0_g1_i1:33-1079(-)